MKKLITLLIVALLIGVESSPAQFLKNLGKRAEEAAKRTVEDRVEQESAEKTDEALDTILEPGSKEKSNKQNSETTEDPDYPGQDYQEDQVYQEEATLDMEEDLGPQNSSDESISVYSKFDFVPGDNLLFFEDFSNDYIGDFPSKWNTNGTGEVVTINDDPQKWFGMKPGHSVYYIPDLPSLPEEYTIEFDLLAIGLDQQTGSTTVLKIILSDDSAFKLGNYAMAQMSFCQYAPIAMRVRNSTGDINNEIAADNREAVKNQPHVSIAVNKQRFRLWLNEKKYIDIPRLIPAETILKALKFELLYFKEGKEQLFITNLKVAEGGQDLRRKLIEEGSVSTNGILFNSGSANLLPQSMGIIRQISQVLQQESNMTLRIVGHTDSDGDDNSNLMLSTKRAEAVKDILINQYQINPARLQAEGKGETEPVGDNDTADGKAQNRRVEFIKM
ncbi:MAG: hypothetical protein DHS20C17_32890 [Cyclobacteriaceae bacterium]|nr:MAG: hypothetical protein DHS20C17_32890 [Cyclobacteriaceae bacterium]